MDKNPPQFIYREPNAVIVKDQNLTILRRNVKQEIVPHFTKEEMVELLRNVPPDKTGMLFQFLWRTGTRVSEALGVTKKDLDFDNGEITIRWLKSRKAYLRVIAMHPSLKAPLYMFTSRLLCEDKLFPFSRQHAFGLAKKHGFGHPHKIRHSFAVNFLRQSDSPSALVELKGLLGHSKIETTMEYLKVVPMAQKASLRRIEFD